MHVFSTGCLRCFFWDYFFWDYDQFILQLTIGCLIAIPLFLQPLHNIDTAVQMSTGDGKQVVVSGCRRNQYITHKMWRRIQQKAFLMKINKDDETGILVDVFNPSDTDNIVNAALTPGYLDLRLSRDMTIMR
jgi:hypothetical protein